MNYVTFPLDLPSVLLYPAVSRHSSLEGDQIVVVVRRVAYYHVAAAAAVCQYEPYSVLVPAIDRL